MEQDMTKEALKLALEALTNAYWPTESDLMPAHNIKECAEAITAIKEALANEALEKMAENARELGLDYEPDGTHHNKPQKRPQNCGTGYCSCIECVMEPAVPDALTASDGESAEYMAGWNDCRQAMLSAKRVGV